MLSPDALPARIRSKIDVRGDDECWPWIAAIGSAGYGKVGWNGKAVDSHRVIYTLLVGPIPEGLAIDHICHNGTGCIGYCYHRRCQNPRHMEPKTIGANNLAGNSPPAVNARKTHCAKGHEYTPETQIIDGGYRRCLLCRREADHKRRPRTGSFYPGTPERIERDAHVVAMFKGGLTRKQIIDLTGIDKNAVWRAISADQSSSAL